MKNELINSIFNDYPLGIVPEIPVEEQKQNMAINLSQSETTIILLELYKSMKFIKEAIGNPDKFIASGLLRQSIIKTAGITDQIETKLLPSLCRLITPLEEEKIAKKIAMDNFISNLEKRNVKPAKQINHKGEKK